MGYDHRNLHSLDRPDYLAGYEGKVRGMNKNNYATLEAAQRLYDAGIVFETDTIYGPRGDLLYKALVECGTGDIPAPSMAEVWRELPFQSYIKQMGDLSLAWICDDDDETKTLESGFIQSTNPTDALIDLLIWVKAQKEAQDE